MQAESFLLFFTLSLLNLVVLPAISPFHANSIVWSTLHESFFSLSLQHNLLTRMAHLSAHAGTKPMDNSAFTNNTTDMKKYLFIIMSFCSFSVAANAQSYLKKYNNDVMFGIHYGTIDYKKSDFKVSGAGIELAILGVYADFDIVPKKDVKQEVMYGFYDEWEDEYAFSFHAGYQFPIAKILKITPVVGYYYHSVGTSKSLIGFRKSDGSIVVDNSYKGAERSKGFEFGAQAQLNIPIGKSTDLALTGFYSKNIWRAGIGIVLHVDELLKD